MAPAPSSRLGGVWTRPLWERGEPRQRTGKGSDSTALAGRATNPRAAAPARGRPARTARYGNTVEPVRYRSISRAASRPSLMARTTRDWPPRQSPAANTLSRLVRYRPFVAR